MRRLGYTDLKLSAIGLGTHAMGGSGWACSWGPQNDKESVDTILCAIEKGINWIDTAPVYSLGHSEEIIGKAIKGIDKKIIIATKCGQVWDSYGNISSRLKRKSINNEIESSLKRLDVDAIDLYQIHLPRPKEDIEEAWSAVVDLIKEGKVRYAGVSNFNLEQLKRLQAIYPIASLQLPYSMLVRDIEDELLRYCAANDIGIIAYSPLQKGLLTGKFTQEYVKNLSKDDYRSKNVHFQEPWLSANLELVDELRPIARNSRRTLTQLAIAWVLRRTEITAAIIGARHPFQIEEDIIGEGRELIAEDIEAIDALLDKHQKRLRLRKIFNSILKLIPF